MMQQHFVIFYSPGTFVAETSSKPIDAWDVETAKEMARTITERHAATPYGFCFITKGREDSELDSKEIARSGFYYLGGTVRTLEELEAKNDPSEAILRSNMRACGWQKIITNNNSWKWTQPLREGDTVLDFSP